MYWAYCVADLAPRSRFEGLVCVVSGSLKCWIVSCVWMTRSAFCARCGGTNIEGSLKFGFLTQRLPVSTGMGT